jgi:PAS domain S-box-containing protein
MVVPSGMPPELAIIVVDAEASDDKVTTAAMQSAGFSNLERITQDEISADQVDAEGSVFVLVGASCLGRLKAFRDDPRTRACCAVALCQDSSQESEALLLGADEVLTLPASPQLLRQRLTRGQERSVERRTLAELQLHQDNLLHMRALITDRGDGADVLREILLMAARVLKFDRASMMAHVDGSGAAYVIAATDDPTLSKFEVAISDYPEVREAIHIGEPLLIADVSKHPSMAHIAGNLSERGVAAMAVFPVTWKGRSMGALLFRKGETGLRGINKNAQAFGSLLASQLAAQLRDSSLFDQLRDQTRRLTRDTFEAERRARVIDSLNDYFEASSEAIFVIDQRGKVIHVNRAAAALTGFAQDALLGSEMTRFFPATQHDSIAEVIDSVFDGDNVERMDMDLENTGGSYTTVSLSTSTVLTKHGAVILSFRDVTQQRSLEAQLQHSNQFLKNLVDSAVDAIIAVDMRGIVIVFNKGAETLFGYDASEVVGKVSVATLYPEGVPSQVMRMLRSNSYGGAGRLEQIRREVVVRGGEGVPVNMTAAMIYEGGQEVASVGIFSDLRDRIRIEQRLLQAQEQLQVQEQRSMLAELAGAAAHELNQPLTSIIGYAQLIQRTSELGANHLRYTDTIVEEADRMADIVKKIGRITHYETVPYVGSTNIVDLDRSIEASESESVPALIFAEDEPTGRISLEQIAETQEEEMRSPTSPIVRQSGGDKGGSR